MCVCALSSARACLCRVGAGAHASWGTVLNFMALADKDDPPPPPVSFHLCQAGWHLYSIFSFPFTERIKFATSVRETLLKDLWGRAHTHTHTSLRFLWACVGTITIHYNQTSYMFKRHYLILLGRPLFTNLRVKLNSLVISLLLLAICHHAMGMQQFLTVMWWHAG